MSRGGQARLSNLSDDEGGVDPYLPDEPRLVPCPDCKGEGVLPGRDNPAAERLCDHPSCVDGEVDEADLEVGP